MQLTKEQKEALHPINIIVFFLSVFVLLAMVYDVVFRPSKEVSTLLHEVDYAVCIVFFIDFLHRLFTAKSKWRYLRWGWIDLLSSIPLDLLTSLSTNVFLAGRLFRVLQLIRVLRAMRSIRHVVHCFFSDRIKSAFASAAIIAFVTLVFSAIGMLRVEAEAPGANIKTPEDALWWAYVTITTVGYGDRFPVTPEGRIIAVILMTVGVALFGTFTAYVASWFVNKDEERKEKERAAEPPEPTTERLPHREAPHKQEASARVVSEEQ